MARFPTTILLATDGSPDARAAGRVAADLADRTRASLHVVHAWDNYYGIGGMVPVAYPLLQQEGARDLVEGEVALLRKAGATVAAAHLVQGPAVEAIVETAARCGAGLVLLGSRGHGGVHRLVMGSVAEGVAHHTRVPVLVMRGSAAAWPPRHIVVGDDAGADGATALDLAAEIAGLYAARLTLVRAMPHMEDALRESGALRERVIDDVLEFAQGELEDHVAALPDDVAPRARVRISVDEPADALLAAADAEENGGDAMIAVGSRGLGALQRIRSGSVSTRMLHAAHCPLLIAPRRTAPVIPLPLLGRHTAAR